MKKTFETTFNNWVVKDYIINKNYCTTIIYCSNDTLEIRLYNRSGKLLSEQVEPKITLKQIELILRDMIEDYETKEALKILEKTVTDCRPPEAQQIKNILTNLITINQAEQYKYITVDSDGCCILWDGLPTHKNTGDWIPPEHVDSYIILTWIKDGNLLSFIAKHSYDLKFELCNLKGVQ